MSKKIHSIWIDPEVYERIKDIAWQDRMRYSEKVEIIFKEYIQKRELEARHDSR